MQMLPIDGSDNLNLVNPNNLTPQQVSGLQGIANNLQPNQAPVPAQPQTQMQPVVENDKQFLVSKTVKPTDPVKIEVKDSVGMHDYSDYSNTSSQYPDLNAVNQYKPSYINPIQGNKESYNTQITGVSKIMNPNITVSSSEFEALSNSVLYPQDYIEKYLGVEALRPQYNKVQEILTKQLSDNQSNLTNALTPQDESYYRNYSNKQVDSSISLSPQVNNPKNPFMADKDGNYDYRGNLSKIIADQESAGSGGYTAKGQVQSNGDQALGKYQIMGNSLLGDGTNGWANEALKAGIINKIPTKEEFVSSPELQDKIANFKLGQYYDTARLKGLSPEKAVKYAGLSWYSGEKPDRLLNGDFVYRPGDEKKQAGGMPSIQEYTEQIGNRLNNNINQFVDNNNKQIKADQLTEAQAKVIPDQIKNFYNTYENKAIPNPEGGYAGQCVSLVRIYYKDTFGIDVPIFGNAADGALEGVLDNKFDLITKPETTKIRQNDMIFIAPNQYSSVGHTAVAASNEDKNGNFTVLESNVRGLIPSYGSYNNKDLLAIRRIKT